MVRWGATNKVTSEKGHTVRQCDHTWRAMAEKTIVAANAQLTTRDV